MEQRGVNVHRDSLVRQARAWEDQGNAMGRVVAEIGAAQPSGAGAALSRAVDPIWIPIAVEAPIQALEISDYKLFQESLTAYEKVRARMAQICQKGQAQLHGIAGALYDAASNYDAAENKNAQGARHIG